MAAKHAKAKPRPKRAAPKAKSKVKTKVEAKGKAKVETKGKTKVETKARKKGSGAKATSSAKATSGAKAKPRKKRPQAHAAAPTPPPPEPVLTDDAPTAETAALEAKKGPLARLAGGVGNLFARMTGKRAPEPELTPAPDQPPLRSPDQTIEISSGDILAVTGAPPPIPKPKS